MKASLVEIEKRPAARRQGVIRKLDNGAGAQKLVDLAGTFAQRVEQDARASQLARWAEQTKADPDIAGKDGRDLLANLRRVKAFVARVGGEAALAALDETGRGSHPALLRMLLAAAKATGRDD